MRIVDVRRLARGDSAAEVSLMRALGLALLCGACAGAPRAVTVPATTTASTATTPVKAERAESVPLTSGDLLPAGICAFGGYFAGTEACEGVPPLTHVVLLADVNE